LSLPIDAAAWLADEKEFCRRREMLSLDRLDKKYQLGIIGIALVALVITGLRLVPKNAHSSSVSSGIAVSCTNPDCTYQGSFSLSELWKLMQDTNAKLHYAEMVPPPDMALSVGWGSAEGPLLCPKCQEASLIVNQETPEDKTRE